MKRAVRTFAIPCLVGFFLLSVGCSAEKTNRFDRTTFETNPSKFDNYSSELKCLGRLQNGTVVLVSLQTPLNAEGSFFGKGPLLVVESRDVESDASGVYTRHLKMIFVGAVTAQAAEVGEDHIQLKAESLVAEKASYIHYPAIDRAVFNLGSVQRYVFDCKNQTVAIEPMK